MSIIERRLIRALRNPVTQAKTGTMRPDQKVDVALPIFALAIAADSDVSMVDVYLRGHGFDPEERIRLAAGAPWLGHIDPSLSPELYVVPVLPAAGLDGFDTIGETPAADYPAVKLDLFTECPPCVTPRDRSAYHKTYKGGPVGDAGTAGSVAVAWCIQGRRHVGVQWSNADHTGAMVGQLCTGTLTLHGYTVAEDGTVGHLSRVVTATTAEGALGELWKEAGIPAASANAGFITWTTAEFELVGAAHDTFTYDLITGAW